MAGSLLSCPICSQPGFQNVDSLRLGLIRAATRQLICPVCQDILLGLDKFTIHLFTHSLHHSFSKQVDLQKSVGSEVSSTPATKILNTGPRSKSFENCRSLDRPCDREDQEHHGSVQECDSEMRVKLENSRNKNGHCCGNEKITASQLVQDASDCAPLNLCNTSGPSSTTCPHCRFSFPDPTILEIHSQLVHQNRDFSKCPSADPEVERRQFPCHVCQKAFKMRGSLMVHMRVAHGGISAGKFVQNPTEAELQADMPSFTCTTCGKSFKKEQHLSQHMKTHEGKQWECEVCSKMFTTKYFLKKHKRLHTGEMPYSCATCNKTFTFQQSYHKHLLYHSDDKPHVCTECDRAFKELSTLHNHQRIHTGEKPFACETCVDKTPLERNITAC